MTDRRALADAIDNKLDMIAFWQGLWDAITSEHTGLSDNELRAMLCMLAGLNLEQTGGVLYNERTGDDGVTRARARQIRNAALRKVGDAVGITIDTHYTEFVPRAYTKATVTRKTCRVCGMSKSAAGFYTSAASPDGLSNVCRSCARRKQAAS